MSGTDRAQDNAESGSGQQLPSRQGPDEESVEFYPPYPPISSERSIGPVGESANTYHSGTVGSDMMESREHTKANFSERPDGSPARRYDVNNETTHLDATGSAAVNSFVFPQMTVVRHRLGYTALDLRRKKKKSDKFVVHRLERQHKEADKVKKQNASGKVEARGCRGGVPASRPVVIAPRGADGSTSPNVEREIILPEGVGGAIPIPVDDPEESERQARRLLKLKCKTKLEEFILYKERKYNSINSLNRYVTFVMVLLATSVILHAFSMSTTEWVKVRAHGGYSSTGLFARCESRFTGYCTNPTKISTPVSYFHEATGAKMCEIDKDFTHRFVGVMWTFAIIDLGSLFVCIFLVSRAGSRPTRTNTMAYVSGLLLISVACGIIILVCFDRFSRCPRSLCALQGLSVPVCHAGYSWGFSVFIAGTCVDFCGGIMGLCMLSYTGGVRHSAKVQLRREMHRREKQKDMQARAEEAAMHAVLADQEERRSRMNSRAQSFAFDPETASRRTDMFDNSSMAYLTVDMEGRRGTTRPPSALGSEIGRSSVLRTARPQPRGSSAGVATGQGASQQSASASLKSPPQGILLPVSASSSNQQNVLGSFEIAVPPALDSASEQHLGSRGVASEGVGTERSTSWTPPQTNFTTRPVPTTQSILRPSTKLEAENAQRNNKGNSSADQAVRRFGELLAKSTSQKGGALNGAAPRTGRTQMPVQNRSHVDPNANPDAGQLSGTARSTKGDVPMSLEATEEQKVNRRRNRHRHHRHLHRDYDPRYLTAEELGIVIDGADDWVYDDRSDLYYSFELHMFWDPLSAEYYNCNLETWQDRPDILIEIRRIPTSMSELGDDEFEVDEMEDSFGRECSGSDDNGADEEEMSHCGFTDRGEVVTAANENATTNRIPLEDEPKQHQKEQEQSEEHPLLGEL